MVSEKVNFRLPEDMLQKADTVAEVSRQTRTDIVKEALKQYLESFEDDEKFRQEIIDLYLENEIGFEVLKEFIGRQDAESVRASKEILEQGDKMAEELADL